MYILTQSYRSTLFISTGFRRLYRIRTAELWRAKRHPLSTGQAEPDESPPAAPSDLSVSLDDEDAGVVRAQLGASRQRMTAATN